MKIEFIPSYLRDIELAITDLHFIKTKYEELKELDIAKENQRLERQVQVLEDKLQTEKEEHAKTIKEKNMEIARLGLAVGEAMKYMPHTIPPSGMDLMP